MRFYRHVNKECQSRGAVGNDIGPRIPDQWFGLLFSEVVIIHNTHPLSGSTLENLGIRHMLDVGHGDEGTKVKVLGACKVTAGPSVSRSHLSVPGWECWHLKRGTL